jgi:DNA-binding MarR family transcriptional regulator
MSNGENAEATRRKEHAQQQEDSLLEALHKKGPAMPAELAVRTYSFPDEISDPLTSLEQKGLVERQPLRSGEMIVLTKEGLNQVQHRGL